MANLSVSRRDRDRLDAARARGDARRSDPSAVMEAAYHAATDAVELTFRGGGAMIIPRRLLPELEGASTSALSSVRLSPAGDALSWRALDVDIFVPGLVEQAFGTRLFAAATGRRGGQRRSKAKQAASRRNGAKGGRPRKRA